MKRKGEISWKTGKSEFSHVATPLWWERKMTFFEFPPFFVTQRGPKAKIWTVVFRFLNSKATKRSIRYALADPPYHRHSHMRKFSAIKINCTLNIYFPRLATQAPHFSGLASERGTRERAWNGRFCHFFGGRGFKPGRGHETKKCYFFFFSFRSSRGKVR